MDALESAFERDLRSWLSKVYQQRAGVARVRLERRVMHILESERRWLVPLTIGVLFGVGAVPMLGSGGVLGSLAVLYIGAVISGYVTMRRAEQVEQLADPRIEAAAAEALAWEQRPPFGPDERARLVRIMNLSRPLAGRRATLRPLLLEEVDAALAHRPLSEWSFIRDLRDLIQSDAADVGRSEGF
jgi:hypothetical protein